MPRADAGQVLLADIQSGQQRQGDDAPARLGGEQSEYHPDVPVDERGAGRPGHRVVVDACALHVRPVPLDRRVVQCQPVGAGGERPHGVVGPTGNEQVRRLPTAATALQQVRNSSLSPAAAGEQGADEQAGEAGGAARVEQGRQPENPVTGWGAGCEDVMGRALRVTTTVW